MKCPNCQHPHSQVTNSRPTTLNDIEGVRRRHECLKCGERFSTFEYVCEIPRGNVPRSVFHPGYDPIDHRNGNGVSRGIVGAKKPTTKYKEEIKRALQWARKKYAEELDEMDDDDFE